MEVSGHTVVVDGATGSGDYEMTELKHRLIETEAQMSRILQAMEVVQQKVGSAAADTAQLTVCFCSLVTYLIISQTASLSVCT